MRFSVWFKMWIRSIHRLVLLDGPRRLTERQRERARKRRIEKKYRGLDAYIEGQKVHRRPDRSPTARNLKFFAAFLTFAAVTLAVVLLPFGMIDWGYKSARVKRGVKSSSPKREREKKQNDLSKSVSERSENRTVIERQAKVQRQQMHRAEADVKKSAELSYTPYVRLEIGADAASDADRPTISDESVPKSSPKHEKDHYIKKRMIIAGSAHCDKEALDKLQIGSCFDLVREPDNPYDKNAVALIHQGEKIGYVARKDVLPFAACLRSNKVIYGVITDILTEGERVTYEYETWFDEGER